jgi:antitoxin HicB
VSTLSYPARFRRDGDVITVSFPDFPEAHTQGSTSEEAFAMASDCLYTAIEWRLERKEEIPAPAAAKRGQTTIPVPLELAPKLALYQAMRSRGVNNVALANRLQVSENAIRRMLAPNHKSRPEQYKMALLALGYTIETSVILIHREGHCKPVVRQ